MEWLRSANGRQVLVLYSIGNLLADQWMLPDAQRSGLVKLTFREDHIAGIEVIPLLMDRASKTQQMVSDQKTRDQIMDRLQINELTRQNPEVVIK
jgi:hypothetical protein